MPDEKISDLPPTASVNANDTFEKSLHNAAPSERVTAAQLATFMQTAMALVQLSGGNIKLNADGSASFAGVKILFNADGSCTFASANAGFAADGALNLPLSHLLADGSAQFANGTMTIGNAGSASFANGGATIDSNGTIDSGLQGISDGLIRLHDNLQGFTMISLTGADGSASFANGNAGIDSIGAITSGSAANAQPGTVSVLDTAGTPTSSISGAGAVSLANTLGGQVSVGGGNIVLNADGNIDTIAVYKVSATQVVGQQQPAIADATNAVDVITQFNTLLAELRTHGLIAV